LYTEPYINKGFAMIELGDRMGALDEFKKAFETDPDYERQIDDVFSDRFGWRGCEYRNQGKINAAIDDFLTAVKIKPDSAVSYYNLACCYAVNNNKEEALYYLGKAINLDPKRRQKAQSDEDFNSIREDADFKKIVSGGMEDDAYVPAEDDAPEED
jgi:Tetratricopeptide repeat.